MIEQQKLYNSFININPQKLNNTVILTAADSKYFIALSTLICSLHLTHTSEQKIICINLGLTKKQIAWLKKYNVEVQDAPRKLLMPRSVKMWQTWNKPQYILQQIAYKHKYVLWIDADCAVLDNLRFIENIVKQQFVVFACTAAIFNLGIEEAIKCLKNNNSLDKFNDGEHPNAGVCAFDLIRDRDLLEKWASKINIIASKQDKYKWYDQGALQEIIEELDETDKVICDIRYNDGTRQANNFDELIDNFHIARREGTRIVHFPCESKPYHKKDYPKNLNINGYPANRQDLKIYVLGHKEKKNLSAPCLNYIHLPDIDRNNTFAESRIFQSNLIEKSNSEYVGLVTAQWDIKYNSTMECCKLEDLYKLPMRKDLVWCGRKADTNWLHQTEKDHPGIKKILNFLAGNIELVNKLHLTTLWSNNFISHKSVVLEIQDWFWKCWSLITKHFGNDVHKLYKYPKEEFSRPLSYLAERFTMMYFCSREDLQLKQIPYMV